MRLKSLGVAAAMLVGSVAATAQADTINFILTGAAPAAGGATFTYNVVLTGNSAVTVGSYATIYDFAGYIPGTATFTPVAAITTTLTEQLTGITPGSTTPFDDPALMNFTITIDTATPDPLTGAANTSLLLGTFSADSTLAFISVNFDYVTTSLDLGPVSGGVRPDQESIASTQGPAASGIPVIPLPAAAWAGLALFGVLGGLRARRNMTA